jgi:hypothetical protein
MRLFSVLFAGALSAALVVPTSSAIAQYHGGHGGGYRGTGYRSSVYRGHGYHSGGYQGGVSHGGSYYGRGYRGTGFRSPYRNYHGGYYGYQGSYWHHSRIVCGWRAQRHSCWRTWY